MIKEGYWSFSGFADYLNEKFGADIVVEIDQERSLTIKKDNEIISKIPEKVWIYGLSRNQCKEYGLITE